jgi:hypothetical protein
MLALTALPHADRDFVTQTFRAVVTDLGCPILSGSVIDLSEPAPWDLYARPLNEVMAIVSPTSYMPILED